MNIKKLEQYTATKNEIKMLENRIVKMQSKKSDVVVDSVTGSSPSFPYTQHIVKIEGVDMSNDFKIGRIRERLKNRKERLVKELEEIEAFIDTVTDSEIRQIIQLRYIDGLPWAKVDRKIFKYSSGDAARKKIERFFAKI